MQIGHDIINMTLQLNLTECYDNTMSKFDITFNDIDFEKIDHLLALAKANNTQGKFSVTLRVDGEPLTFEVTLDFNEPCSVTYSTSSPLIHGRRPGRCHHVQREDQKPGAPRVHHAGGFAVRSARVDLPGPDVHRGGLLDPRPHVDHQADRPGQHQASRATRTDRCQATPRIKEPGSHAEA